MNTASRMESTGESGRIQLSEDTAMLLAEAGKAKWIEKREGTVDGIPDGSVLGCIDTGDADGGVLLGLLDGFHDEGITEGFVLGRLEGASLGVVLGPPDGSDEGPNEGNSEEGVSLG